MFLTPHHFQQSDRYQEALILEGKAFVNPFYWGVNTLEIDPDALVNGSLALLRLKGVMSDGFSIDIPDRDPAPPIRSVQALFPATLDHLDVYLGLPLERTGAANCASSDSDRLTRYISEPVQTPDLNTGEQIREVTVARGNFKVFFSNEEMSNFTTLKVAALVRTPAGVIVLKEDYIPPCLAISASAPLLQRLQGLVSILSAKANLLTGQRLNAAGGGGDLVQFSLWYTLNTALPLLSHFIRIGAIHPETFYRTLVQLAGSLVSFSSHHRLADLPAYHHTDLHKTFHTLDGYIRAIVEESSKSRQQVIPLSKVTENVWEGTISDERILQSGEFFLGVSGSILDSQIPSIPKKVKIASKNDIDLMVTAALPGLRIVHAPRPPSALSIQPGSQYFKIDQQGEHWKAICQSGKVGLYVPMELQEFEFELLVIKQ